jgi:hypothetical protein
VGRSLAHAATLTAVLALVACGGGGEDADTASGSSVQTRAVRLPEVEGVPPTPRSLARGTWSRIGERLFLRFNANGTFGFDRAGFRDGPAISGTYELNGRTMRFATESTSGLCPGEKWTWKVGLTDDDVLHVVWVTEGCDIVRRTQWSFALLPPG